ncbi:hypothetical protein SAMN04487830_1397 [Pseudobutyrivibrio sp. OR37]|uniref:hypothetical protein n=1 Tax=Pseudobutyrivibrio sp. OR37 TaxID=1798186 RepID=UPI0008E85049|nr:hypothetical protein [Pseudobutyrivibrio sp. OR37]SFI29823.1 hypothetical protein SAMN04487830_1397 [Pseudobutyrivibrio sp. OR37]
MSMVVVEGEYHESEYAPPRENYETVIVTAVDGRQIKKTRKLYLGIDGRILKAEEWIYEIVDEKGEKSSICSKYMEKMMKKLMKMLTKKNQIQD